MAQAERDASDPMTPFGYQEDGSYVPCPDCFTLPDGGCAAGGHGDAVALTASPVSIEVYEHPSGQIQVMIGDDSGGFRLAGPKFDGTGSLLTKGRVNKRTARELQRWASIVLGDNG